MNLCALPTASPTLYVFAAWTRNHINDGTLTGRPQQLLKAINKLPGLSQTEIDNEAILLRAYGKGTDVLIDRKSECTHASAISAGSH